MEPSKLIIFIALYIVNVCVASPLPGPQYYADAQYDVIVIGGGPSGLSALSGLARVRRNVLLIDSGEYRNGQTRHIHDLLGNDGTTPAYFRWLAREQISRYPTAKMINGTITSIENKNNGSYFIAKDRNGTSYSGRKVVLATGLIDVLPPTPGLADVWSRGVYWCPWCDGYEHRDQSYGIIGPLDGVQATTYEIETLNKNAIGFVNGTYTDDYVSKLNASTPGWQDQLKAWNITIDNRTITSITRLQDGATNYSTTAMAEYDQFRLDFTEGPPAVRDAFIVSFPSKQRSSLGKDLGVRVIESAKEQKLFADISSGLRTNLYGVYAVGDCNTDNSTNVPHAMWSGKRAAVSIHVEIAKQEAKVAAGQAKRDFPVNDEEMLQFMGRDIDEVWKRSFEKD